MSKVPIYISFDYDHDLDCKTLLVGQAKNPDSPFEIADWSVKVSSARWKSDAKNRIRHAKLMIVICGEHTNTATGVNEEIRIAQSENKPYILLAGRSNRKVRKPTVAHQSDRIHEWSWDNLKKLIAGYQ